MFSSREEENLELVRTAGGCKVPVEWDGGLTDHTNLPVYVKDVRLPFGGWPANFVGGWAPRVPYISSEVIKPGGRVNLQCPNGCFVDGIYSSLCHNKSGIPTFDLPPSGIACKGCSDPENLIDVPDKAPLLPVTLEVKKNDRGEWIKREKDSAIGVGDLVRFRCATGKLVTLSESSSFSSDVSDSSSPSAAAPRSDGRTLDATAGDSNDEMHVVECQWKGEIPGEREQSAVWGNPMRCLSAEGKTRPRPGFNSTVTVKCEGCRVPGEWLGRITGESPYPVMVTGIYRAYPWTREGEGGIDEGDHEAAGFVDSKTSIGINDTISFECVRGGVLRLQSSLSQSGSAGLRGATCVNPGGEELGESEFDLNISDVKCARGWGEVVTQVLFWTIVALLLSAAAFHFVWSTSKDARRRRRIARLLDLQTGLVTPRDANLSVMQKETTINVAREETNARQIIERR